MRKTTLLLVSLFWILGIQAQTLETYQFQQENLTGTWNNNLTGMTEITFSNLDDGEQSITIPFTFKYAGHSYTDVRVGVNGGIRFGTTGDIFSSNNLSSTDAGHTNIIAPLWDDWKMVAADNPRISYKLYGSAPNRYLLIDWKNMRHYGSSATGYVSFRLLLRETTNVIEFLYGPSTSSTMSASIGFNANDGTTTTFVSVTPGNSATVSTTTANNSISTTDYPAGKHYIFSPQPPNDFYTLPTVITVNDANADPVSHAVSAYNAGATNSGGTAPQNGMWSTSSRDIWYRFTAPAGGIVSLTRPDQGSWSSLSYAFYPAGGATGPEIVSGYINSSHIGKKVYITGLTPGNDYLIRMWDFGNNQFGYMHFCLREGQVNEDAENAIQLGVFDHNASMILYVNANNQGADNSAPINGTPSCGSFGGNDVWYKFTAPSDGKVEVVHSDTAGDWSSFVFAVYYGPTYNTEISCDIIYISGHTAPYDIKTITGLTAGSTYYLRTYDYGNNDFGISPFYLRTTAAASGIENIASLDFNYYPNPASDVINVNAQGNIQKIELYNINGQVVKSIEPNNEKATLDISTLPNGLYLMKVQNDKSVKTVKIIKK